MDNRYRDPRGQGNYGRQQEQFSEGSDRYGSEGGQGSYGGRQQQDYNRNSASQSQYGAGDRYSQGQSGGYNPMNDYDQGSQYGQSQYGQQSRDSSHSYFRGDDYGGRNMGGMSGQSYGSGSYGGGSYAGGTYGGGTYGGGMSGGQDYYGGSSYGSRQSGYGGNRNYSGGQDYDRNRDNDRGFFDRMTDKIGSWFGDDNDNRRYGSGGGSAGGMYSSGETHRGRGPGNYKRSDERILDDACDRLTDDHHIDATGIEVTVQNGEVTLDGTVSDRMAKRRAEDVIENLSGVKHVQNNLRVRDSSMGGDSYTTGGMTSGSGSMSGSKASGSGMGGVKETPDVKRDPDATNKATAGTGSTT